MPVHTNVFSAWVVIPRLRSLNGLTAIGLAARNETYEYEDRSVLWFHCTARFRAAFFAPLVCLIGAAVQRPQPEVGIYPRNSRAVVSPCKTAIHFRGTRSSFNSNLRTSPA